MHPHAGIPLESHHAEIIILIVEPLPLTTYRLPLLLVKFGYKY
jgi:hypothetical protein